MFQRKSFDVERYDNNINVDLDYRLIDTKDIVSNIPQQTDIYCWYEGLQGLPQSCATYMRDNIFTPVLSTNRNIKFILYSLRGWDFKKYSSVSKMPDSTPLSQAVNNYGDNFAMINSFDYFKYCSSFNPASILYLYIKDRLINKQNLIDLSSNRKELGIKVGELFDNQPSLLECIYALDISRAYSLMQYVEGLYLVYEAVKQQLLANKKEISILFLLPNDEGKYYTDIPDELEDFLRYSFGDALSDIKVNVQFKFFLFGKSPSERPYIDKSKKPAKVTQADIAEYLVAGTTLTLAPPS